MPPKSRRAYFKSFFRFGSSKREVKGRPSGEHRLADDIATSGTLNEPSVSTTLPSLTPYLGHDVLTTQDDAVEPRLDSGITMGNLLALASSPTPTPVFPSTSPQLTPHSASSSLFANAQNFHLQNLHYYHQIPSPGLDSSSRSATGWRMLLEHTAPTALYDSTARFDPPRCDEDTRLQVIEDIATWIEDRESPIRLLCMTGAAGAGKSALQQTISEKYTQSKILAASFFFSSADPTRNHNLAFVPTIAYQLGLHHSQLRHFIGEAVDDDHLIFQRSLKTQMEALVVRPVERFRHHMPSAPAFSLPFLVTIDGLDECNGERRQKEILSAIHTSLLLSDKTPFRIFLSSRPELSIRTAVEGYLEKFTYHLRLSDDFDATEDIRRMALRRLREIGRQSRDPRAQPHLWPTVEDVDDLVHAASGQFIYVATAIRYISKRRGSPIQRLQTVLEWGRGRNQPTIEPFALLDLLYLSILSNAKEAWDASNPGSPDDFVTLLRVFERYRNAAYAYSSYLVVPKYHESNDFCLLLGLDDTLLDIITLDLRSLVRVTGKYSGSLHGEGCNHLHLYHRSFSEFLNTESRAKTLYRSRLLVDEFIVCRLMQQACHGPNPDIVDGAIKSLQSSVYRMIDSETLSNPQVGYRLTHKLYEAFVQFTCDNGWALFFQTCKAGEWYTDLSGMFGPANATEAGLGRLFVLVLEYAKGKDLDRALLTTIRVYQAILHQKIHRLAAVERHEIEPAALLLDELPFASPLTSPATHYESDGGKTE
ncbi:hypothetical protein FA13DRAFT_1814443 [Coprinellus micaceus]|uniref:Nephrocystin 3-like N-terminal domain-containing protein n=1 Tax=Coprinellus micaceus TaxID=71717 RepID=A0A4Y7T8W1_COPMI|nr:hypothetical protein FA13DRAFT_1814443 [Coprinellus micaceus]